MLRVLGDAVLVHGCLRLPILGAAVGREACRDVVPVQVGVVGLQVAQLIVVVGLLERRVKAVVLRKISHGQGQQPLCTYHLQWHRVETFRSARGGNQQASRASVGNSPLP